MTYLIILAFIIGASVVFFFFDDLLKNPQSKKKRDKKEKNKLEYKYTRKQFFLTRAENEFYQVLMTTLGNEYYIFAQVHLPTILDHKAHGQNWKGAFSHINRKSVDFVICDREYISPKLAIELDDKTHERPDRQERDSIVENLLKEAEMPLLRIKNQGSFNPAEVEALVRSHLN